MKFTRSLSIPQIVLIFCLPHLFSCQKRDEPKVAQKTVLSFPEYTPLEEGIAKMIRQEPYNSNLLKSLLKGKTWEVVEPIILATKEKVQKEMGQEPDKKAVVKTILKIRSTMSENEIEASRVRQKETLRKITKELREMAEEEGLLSQ